MIVQFDKNALPSDQDWEVFIIGGGVGLGSGGQASTVYKFLPDTRMWSLLACAGGGGGDGIINIGGIWTRSPGGQGGVVSLSHPSYSQGVNGTDLVSDTYIFL